MSVAKKAGYLVVCACLLTAGCDKVTKTAKSDKAEAVAVPLSELNDATFDSHLARGVMLVVFYASWCKPCRLQEPIVESVAQQVGSTVRFFKVNVDNAPDTAQKYGADMIPTLILFKNGKPVKQFVGITNAEDLMAAIQASR